MGEIDEIVAEARKFYENEGYVVDKVKYESGTVTVECSYPEKVTFFYYNRGL